MKQHRRDAAADGASVDHGGRLWAKNSHAVFAARDARGGAHVSQDPAGRHKNTAARGAGNNAFVGKGGGDGAGEIDAVESAGDFAAVPLLVTVPAFSVCTPLLRPGTAPWLTTTAAPARPRMSTPSAFPEYARRGATVGHRSAMKYNASFGCAGNGALVDDCADAGDEDAEMVSGDKGGGAAVRYDAVADHFHAVAVIVRSHDSHRTLVGDCRGGGAVVDLDDRIPGPKSTPRHRYCLPCRHWGRG